jgi:hypothetical protein
LGSADNVVELYLQRTNDLEGERLRQSGEATLTAPRRWGSHKIEISQVTITDANGIERSIFQTGEWLTLQMKYYAHERIANPNFGIAIHRQDGALITGPNTNLANLELPQVQGEGLVTYSIPYLPLLEGLYQFSVAVVNQSDTETFDYHDRLYPFRVINRGGEVKEQYGLVTLRGEWQHAAYHG